MQFYRTMSSLKLTIRQLLLVGDLNEGKTSRSNLGNRTHGCGATSIAASSRLDFNNFAHPKQGFQHALNSRGVGVNLLDDLIQIKHTTPAFKYGKNFS